MSSPRRHRWDGGSTCALCGLHREGAGHGPYGAMRYFRDDSNRYGGSPGACPGVDVPRALSDPERDWRREAKAEPLQYVQWGKDLPGRSWTLRIEVNSHGANREFLVYMFFNATGAKNPPGMHSEPTLERAVAWADDFMTRTGHYHDELWYLRKAGQIVPVVVDCCC